MKIAIVGAGISGVLTAYYLSKKGHVVTVFDREDGVAKMCSKANGGQISVCNAETWNTFQNISKGLRWMLKKDAPLLIRPKPSIRKLLWIAGFLRHTVNGQQLSNTHETIDLALQSSDLYDEIISHENLKFDQSKCGLLHVYTSEKSLDEGFNSERIFREHAVEWKFLSKDKIIRKDPNMKNFKDLKGGFLTSSDWTGDANLFCEELKKVCVKNGVQFKFNYELMSIAYDAICVRNTVTDLVEHDLFDKIILCNGHELYKWANTFGDFLNIYPVKGYSITIPNASAAPAISLLDGDKKIVSSKLGSRFRVAGTAELDDANLEIRADRIKPLVEWAKTNFQHLDVTNYESWACLRPMSSNMMPIVRGSKNRFVIYNGGHGHLGWTLGAATAKKVEQLVDM